MSPRLNRRHRPRWTPWLRSAPQPRQAHKVNTASELYERGWPVIVDRVRGGTARAYRAVWNIRVGPTFGDTAVTTLTTLAIEEAFASWSGASSTRNDALYLLGALCKHAVKGGIIAANPCTGVERRKSDNPDPTGRALSPSKVQSLSALLPASGPYRRFVLAMFYTACRLGEIAGMRVGDVDLETLSISVRRTASAALHGRLSVGPTKGGRTRIASVPDPFVPEVLAAMEGKGEHDLLFPGPRGGYINSKNLSRGLDWMNIRDQIKTFPPEEHPLKWHDPRHTGLTNLFLAGLSAPDVQAIAGHASLFRTQTYTNTRRDAARRGAAALNAFCANEEKLGHPPSGGNDVDFSKREAQ